MTWLYLFVLTSLAFAGGWCLRVRFEPESLREMRRDRDDLELQLDRVYHEVQQRDLRMRRLAAEREAMRSN